MSALLITPNKHSENQAKLKKDKISWTRPSKHKLLSERNMLNMAYCNIWENQLKWSYNQFLK